MGSAETRGRWLWITPEIRDELDTGALVYSLNLLRAVAERGVDIEVVGLGERFEATDHLTAHLVQGRLRGGPRSIVSTLPNLAYAAGIGSMRRSVQALLTRQWDVVVIDGLQAAWCANTVAAHHAGPVVFIAHNHEASLRHGVAMDAPRWSTRRPVLMLDAWKAARLERRTVRGADLVTSITDTDRSRFEADAPATRHLTLVPGWSGTVKQSSDRTPIGHRPRAVAMLGSFGWHVKQENLRRFVTAADPIFAAAGVEVLIGGRVPDELQRELSALSSATRFVGWVDDAAAFFDRCRVGLISEPLGGGFKLKALDYVFHGLPLATLRGGGAGLPLAPGHSMIEADDEAALAHAVVAVIDDHERLTASADAARAACAEMTWPGRAAALVAAVDHIL